MSEASWFFGVVCGAAVSIAAIPFAASYVRNNHVDLCSAYTNEVKLTMPSAVRKYMVGKPVDSFIINLLQAQPAVEKFASEVAEELVADLVRKEGKSFCYIQMYLNIALPQAFEAVHVEPLVRSLNAIRN